MWWRQGTKYMTCQLIRTALCCGDHLSQSTVVIPAIFLVEHHVLRISDLSFLENGSIIILHYCVFIWQVNLVNLQGHLLGLDYLVLQQQAAIQVDNTTPVTSSLMRSILFCTAFLLLQNSGINFWCYRCFSSLFSAKWNIIWWQPVFHCCYPVIKKTKQRSDTVSQGFCSLDALLFWPRFPLAYWTV